MATKKNTTNSKKKAPAKKAPTAAPAKLKGTKAALVRAMEKKGLETIGDLAREVDCSTTYARKTLFAWADAGLINLQTNEDETRLFVTLSAKGKRELRV